MLDITHYSVHLAKINDTMNYVIPRYAYNLFSLFISYISICKIYDPTLIISGGIIKKIIIILHMVHATKNNFRYDKSP